MIFIEIIINVNMKLYWLSLFVLVNEFKNIFLFKKLFKKGIFVIDNVVSNMIICILGKILCILFSKWILCVLDLWLMILMFINNVYLKIVWFIKWNKLVNKIKI